MTTAPDIFLSYNREDQAVAKRFAEAFEAAGLSVWWDVTLRSGEAYDKVTEDALRSARAVVVLWSPRSVDSRWVRAEATLADRNRTLVPARIEACDLPIMFELTQTSDLSHWRGEAADATWLALLGDVRRMVEAKPLDVNPANARHSTQHSHGKKPSIAVLPFVNRSGLPEDEVFAEGMVEDLTAALSLSRRMKVIASSATVIYRAAGRDLRQIGQALGVRYLLEGNVRRVGPDLRVTAQLVEAEDGDIVWMQKFDRPLAELAMLQEELVTEVAAHLGVQVQRSEIEHALRKPGDITAWEAVMRAEAGLSRLTLAGAEAAVTEAKRAIAIDPEYDAAYGILVVAQAVCLGLHGSENADMAQELSDTILRARALDSNDAAVVARIAAALSFLGRFEEALPIAERSVAINPNLENPRMALGEILLRLGRCDEAIEQSTVAERLAPNGIYAHAPMYNRSLAHFSAGRIEMALESVDQALRYRSYPTAELLRIICLTKLDRWVEARAAMRDLRSSHPEMTLPLLEKIVLNGLFRGIEGDHIGEHAVVVRTVWQQTGYEV
jgi:TolB-like protein